jgi:hypothetical protein
MSSLAGLDEETADKIVGLAKEIINQYEQAE